MARFFHIMIQLVVLLCLVVQCDRQTTTPARKDRKDTTENPVNKAGLALFAAGDFAAAAKRFEEAEREFPGEAEYPNNAGMCFLHEGDTERAAEKFSRAVELNPKEPLYHYNLGLARIQRGESRQALDAFEEAVALRSDYFDALIYLGTIHYELKEPARAEKAWRQALEIKDEPEIATRLGVLLMQGGKQEEAEKMLLRAVQAKPGELAHYNLGVLYQQKKEFASAEKHYRKAIRLNPRNHVPYFNLGLVQKAQGKNAIAAATFENFLKAVPPTMVRQIQDARAYVKELRDAP